METIRILPSKKKLKELIVDDAVAKRAIQAKIDAKHPLANRVKYLNRDEIIKLFNELFDATMKRHNMTDTFEVLIVKAKKGTDLKPIFDTL